MVEKIEWSNKKDTKRFADHIAKVLMSGDIMCLSGELGAGKTTFTKYLASALGITKNIKSPTYTIIREYETEQFPFYHMDAYRLEETGTDGIGLEEYLESEGVTVIEWPQFIKDELGLNYVWLTFNKTGNESRQITIEGTGPRGKQLERLFAESDKL